MWNNISFDLLARIFFFLPPDSLARASSVCHHWHTCVKLYPLPSITTQHQNQNHPAWFLAFPSRNRASSWYVHNPIIDSWHLLPLGSLSDPIRPISSAGGFLLVRPTNSTVLKLALFNPFTRQFRYLPKLNIARSTPAVGVAIAGPAQQGPLLHFRIYVAGGMSVTPCGASTYEYTSEMYDSREDTWNIVGPIPTEFTVRLTVWTPNESVYIKGVLYWITSARAYSIMGFEIRSNTWRQLSAPMADKLEFATLVTQTGRLTLVGGTSSGDAYVWEINEDDDTWRLIEKVPSELGMRLLGGKLNWGSTKCVGIDGAICLYREIGLGMIVWREVGIMGKREWKWVNGCSLVRVRGGKQVQNVAIKGFLIHPSLALFHPNISN